jgi:DNA-binding IclR family transcriptional regulator
MLVSKQGEIALLGTVGKAGRVLDLFTTRNPEWGVTEVAEALDLPRSSAHDLLATLAATGLLCHAAGNRYRLGWKVVALGRTLLATSGVRAHAQPVMRALVDRLGATVHLATLDDGEVLYIDKLAPRGAPPVSVSAIGTRLPPHCSAVGKVLLAHAPHAALDRCGMRAFTERTITSVDALALELEAIRARGTARDRGEILDGVCCHAAPVMEGGRVVAALSVSVPPRADERFAARYAETVRAAATRVSRNVRAAAA